MLGMTIIPAFSVDEEITDREIMAAPLEDDIEQASTSYINDIEILGANIIKPELKSFYKSVSVVYSLAFCDKLGLRFRS